MAKVMGIPVVTGTVSHAASQRDAAIRIRMHDDADPDGAAHRRDDSQWPPRFQPLYAFASGGGGGARHQHQHQHQHQHREFARDGGVTTSTPLAPERFRYAPMDVAQPPSLRDIANANAHGYLPSSQVSQKERATRRESHRDEWVATGSTPTMALCDASAPGTATLEQRHGVAVAMTAHGEAMRARSSQEHTIVGEGFASAERRRAERADALDVKYTALADDVSRVKSMLTDIMTTQANILAMLAASATATATQTMTPRVDRNRDDSARARARDVSRPFDDDDDDDDDDDHDDEHMARTTTTATMTDMTNTHTLKRVKGQSNRRRARRSTDGANRAPSRDTPKSKSKDDDNHRSIDDDDGTTTTEDTSHASPTDDITTRGDAMDDTQLRAAVLRRMLHFQRRSARRARE